MEFLDGSRRRFLRVAGLAGTGALLNSCGLAPLSEPVGDLSEPLNERVETLLFRPEKAVPEYPVSAIQPDALLVNSFNGVPQIDLGRFRLVVDGAVSAPMQFDMEALQRLPLSEMVIQHVCVEGWAAIVQWGGVRLRDLARLVQPKAGARYVYFESGDQYYESWDIASALHPQTLMAYQKNGVALAAENGAPLRLASPIKLGYKQSKWVTRITFLEKLPAQTGYWEDKGYEWFAGL
jgi:DMSO/TMAO reductase YedYZ molybdopterin-dependent catalytic subunit